jgi:hypothetical protein
MSEGIQIVDLSRETGSRSLRIDCGSWLPVACGRELEDPGYSAVYLGPRAIKAREFCSKRGTGVAFNRTWTEGR